VARPLDRYLNLDHDRRSAVVAHENQPSYFSTVQSGGKRRSGNGVLFLLFEEFFIQLF
jgi:hypothetical protein